MLATLMIEMLKGDPGMRVQLAFQSLEFYISQLNLCVPGFNASTCRSSSSEVDSTWSPTYLPNYASGRVLDLGTSPISYQKRVCSEHVAKLREDP